MNRTWILFISNPPTACNIIKNKVSMLCMSVCLMLLLKIPFNDQKSIVWLGMKLMQMQLRDILPLLL